MKKILFLIIVCILLGAVVIIFSQSTGVDLMESPDNTPKVSQWINVSDLSPEQIASYQKLIPSGEEIVGVKEADDLCVQVVATKSGNFFTDLEWIEPNRVDQWTQRTLSGMPYHIAKRQGKYGIIDTTGRIVFPFVHDHIVLPIDFKYLNIYETLDQTNILSVSDSSFPIIRDNVKVGLADREGNIIIPCEYAHLEILDNEHILAQKYDKTLSPNNDLFSKLQNMGIKDTRIGHNELEYPFSEFKEKYIIKSVNEGVIDFNNKVIIPIKYPYLNRIGVRDYIICSQDGKEGVLDYNNKQIIPFEYSSVNIIDEKYFYVKKDEKVAILDNNNNIVIPFEYLNLTVLNDKYIYAEKYFDDKYNHFGLIDFNNNIIIPFSYLCSRFDEQNIYYGDDDFICVNYINGTKKSKIIDINNKVLYEYVGFVKPIYLKSKDEKTQKLFSKKVLMHIGSSNPNIIMDVNGKAVADLNNNYYQVTRTGILNNIFDRLQIINTEGVKIFDKPDYTAYAIPNAFILHYKNSLYGLIDKDGKQILDTDYRVYIPPTYVYRKPGEDKYIKTPTAEEYKYICFTNPNKSVIVNLQNFKTDFYDIEIAGIDNEGQVYIKKANDDGSFDIIPYTK